MDFTLEVELAAQEAVETVYKNFFQSAISRTEPNSVNSDLAFLLNKKDFIISSEIVLYRVCQKSRIRSWNLEVFTFEYPLRLLVLFYLNSLRHSELSNVRIRTYHN
jgi:hypothetical protein